MFSDIENIDKNKHTRKERHKKKFSSDNFDSDDFYGPPTKVLKGDSKSTALQSHKNNITNICLAYKSREANVGDINDNTCYHPSRKVIRHAECAVSHNKSRNEIVNNEEIIDSEDSCEFNSELELKENYSNFETVDKNNTEFRHIKENNNVNAVACKNRTSTSEINMLRHGEYEGNIYI